MAEHDICRNRERPVQTVYLHKSKRKDGRVHLALVEGYREDGKVKHRTVESLGYLDEPEREHEGPIAHFRQACDEANAAARAGRQSVQIAIRPSRRSTGARPRARTSARRCCWPSAAPPASSRWSATTSSSVFDSFYF